ncbi:hypothetical protein GMRT_11058 [Giardia muris]|uniref:Uncharacterized protein n=1 Tax=Giardia muris TaxID=5742 RepID=A0A4Z1SZS3_GIAMU|nr:hypothetical protein GMRT_11058 [Giardia muris]|eukprot:TNJ27153.1 hypothetical protein GMRT_11058 [Giardia muris]
MPVKQDAIMDYANAFTAIRQLRECITSTTALNRRDPEYADVKSSVDQIATKAAHTLSALFKKHRISSFSDLEEYLSRMHLQLESLYPLNSDLASTGIKAQLQEKIYSCFYKDEDWIIHFKKGYTDLYQLLRTYSDSYTTDMVVSMINTLQDIIYDNVKGYRDDVRWNEIEEQLGRALRVFIDISVASRYTQIPLNLALECADMLSQALKTVNSI